MTEGRVGKLYIQLADALDRRDALDRHISKVRAELSRELRQKDLPLTVEAILENPNRIKELAGRDPDVVEAVLTSINQRYQDHELGDPELAQVYDYAIKHALPIDIVWAAFTRVSHVVAPGVRNAVSKAVQSQLDRKGV